jgi:hypothetical protein
MSYNGEPEEIINFVTATKPSMAFLLSLFPEANDPKKKKGKSPPISLLFSIHGLSFFNKAFGATRDPTFQLMKEYSNQFKKEYSNPSSRHVYTNFIAGIPKSKLHEHTAPSLTFRRGRSNQLDRTYASMHAA